MSDERGPSGLSFEEFTAQFDLREQQQRHKELERRHARTVQRWRSGSLAVGYASAAATAVGLAYVVYLSAAGPSAKEQLQHEEKIQCTDEDGTWIKVADGDQSTGYGTCLFGRTE